MGKFFQGRYIFHLLFWAMYAVFTILETQSYIVKKGIVFELTPLTIFFSLMGLLMLGNNRLLIPALLEKGKTALYVAGIVLFIICYTYFRSLNQQYWDGIVWPKERMTIQSYFLWNFLYAIWFIIISSLLYFTQKWTDHRQQAKNIKVAALQTELKYLRSQLNPHFLFNGLNTIYGNIDMSNQVARNILLQFSDLLRYNLYEADTDSIELGKEAEHLQNYVDLQRARSDSNLKIDLEIQVADKDLKVAPLLFMAFVENAFKYSPRDNKQANLITIRLQQTRRQLLFECRNACKMNAGYREGIGLNNASRRLELLYKDRYTLSIKKEDGFFEVKLTIQL